MNMENEIAQKGLAALPLNEPIDWLLGRVLRNCAARGENHSILNALAGSNPYAVKAWNAWIAEFRSVLKNPDGAARKADEELGTSPAKRIDDFMTEVFAILHLSRSGYSDFEVVLAGAAPAVDFVASNDGKVARVEVKRLHEPQDIIRNVALARWNECRAKNPDKFNFRAVLNHSHHGPLSDAAISNLRNLIDQFPNRAGGECTVTLDGGVSVRLRRIDSRGPSSPQTDGEMLLQTTIFPAERTGLLITSAITEQDLEFDLPELQRLFVKAMRTVADATPKFFGRQSDTGAENLIAMEWQAPKLFFDDAAPLAVSQAIESAFSAVGLHLKVLIFGRRYKAKLRVLAKESRGKQTVELDAGTSAISRT